MLSGRSSFASRRMMLKKIENSVGARMHPCLTLVEMRKLPDRLIVLLLTLLTFLELAENGEKF